MARFDLGKIEDIVDQAQKMAPALLYPFQDVPDLFGHIAVYFGQ